MNEQLLVASPRNDILDKNRRASLEFIINIKYAIKLRFDQSGKLTKNNNGGYFLIPSHFKLNYFH